MTTSEEEDLLYFDAYSELPTETGRDFFDALEVDPDEELYFDAFSDLTSETGEDQFFLDTVDIEDSYSISIKSIQ